jgi:hypothetical protein
MDWRWYVIWYGGGEINVGEVINCVMLSAVKLYGKEADKLLHLITN